MLGEKDKYVSNLCKVVRIAMLAPFANLILFPIKTFIELGLIGFIIYVVFSITSFFVGYKLIDFGCVILILKETTNDRA